MSEGVGGRASFKIDRFCMIRDVEIENFKCYKNLNLGGFSRVNVIVGDSGSGKTAFLEALFLALGCASDLAIRFRQMRGLDTAFTGPPKRIEQSLWQEYFYNNAWENPIKIALHGDAPEARTVEIYRGGPGETILPFNKNEMVQATSNAPINISWINSEGKRHSLSPSIAGANGFIFPDTGEDLPGFFYFSSQSPTSSAENASRFSDLSKEGKHRKFISIFLKEYDWISDLNVEVHGGTPAIFATIKGSEHKLPVANVSAGINRLMGILLAISSQERGIILIDEIENGIYYTHIPSMWKTIISLADEFEAQIFVSTHSRECLQGLGKAIGRNTKEVTLLRARKSIKKNTRDIKLFSGSTLLAGIDYDEEIR